MQSFWIDLFIASILFSATQYPQNTADESRVKWEMREGRRAIGAEDRSRRNEREREREEERRERGLRATRRVRGAAP